MISLKNAKDLFPQLKQKINGSPLLYLDTAASALKPISVIECINNFYKFEASNVHRAAHFLSNQATQKYEDSRVKVKNFIGAAHENEIVFTSGTTDSINLVAQSWGKVHLGENDEIILSEMEHHSNIVPWLLLQKVKKFKINWLTVDQTGEINLTELKNLLNPNTKLLSLTHCSNVLGTVNPIEECISLAHSVGAKVLIDAAQSVSFASINVTSLKCDFLVFSAHKLYGPYGVGVLYARSNILENMPAVKGGGSSISKVTKTQVVFLSAPYKFEPGTPNISGAIGLGAAIDFISDLGLKNIFNHEKNILSEFIEKLKKIPALQFIGSSNSRVNLLSFQIAGVNGSDFSQMMDKQGIAIRTGHHCAQPLMDKLGIEGSIRLSLGVYNSEEDVGNFIKALNKTLGILL